MDDLRIEEKELPLLHQQRQEAANAIDQLRERVGTLAAELDNAEVTFCDPAPGFD